MADYVSLLMLALQVANLAAAAYLLAIVARMYFRNGNGSFSRATKAMGAAVLLFFAVQFAQVFRLIPDGLAGGIQTLFSLVFLLLLIMAMREITRGVLAHDHLMRRKQKARLVDVE